jgi:hypothetical protein
MKSVNECVEWNCFPALSGTIELNASDIEEQNKKNLIIHQMKESGQLPYNDGLFRKIFDCQVINRYTINKWFGGRKYFLVIKIQDIVKEYPVDVEVYYNQNINKIQMESSDGKIWFPIKSKIC